MPTYDPKRNDIGILRSDASTYVGLMLAVDQGGKPMYKTSTERYLKNQYYAGAPDYGALDPQNEIAIILDDFRSGFGLEVADGDDPKRYYSSINMDLRHRGMAIAGPTPRVFSHPDSANVPTITNATFETDSSGWDYSSAGVTYCDSEAQVGSASLRIANATDTETGQYLEGWTPGVQYTFTCQSKTSVADGVTKIGVADGNSTTWSLAADTDWGALTAQHTVSTDSADYFRLVLYSDGVNHDAYFDTASITMDADSLAVAYTGVTRAFAEFDDDLYYTLDKKLIKIDATAGTSHLCWVLPANITDLEPFTDNKLYICQGWSAVSYVMADSFGPAGCTILADGSATMKYMQTVHTTQDVMYGSDENNTIRADSAPSTDTWGGQTIVGADYHDITGLFDKAGALYIPKEDMLYHLDSDGAVQNSLAPRLQALTKSTSGKNALTDGDVIMYPAGDQGLLEIDGTTLTWLNPSLYCTNLSSFVGRVQALAYDEAYWYAIVDNGSNVEVLAGRWETIGTTTSFVWHPIAEITMTNCETAFVSSVYKKRLYVAPTVDSDSLYYITLPVGYGNMASDANRYFATDGYFTTPWQHGGFKGENKAWTQVTATLGHAFDTDSAVYLECHYQKKGDTAWTNAGDFQGSATDRKPTLFLPVDSDSSAPVSPMMRFKIVAKTDCETDTPILDNLDVRAILKPTHRKIIECVVRCADKILGRDGNYLEGTSASDIRTVLNEARDATWPFKFYDIHGDTIDCIMLPNDPESTMVTDLKEENPEQLYHLRMQVVALS